MTKRQINIIEQLAMNSGGLLDEEREAVEQMMIEYGAYRDAVDEIMALDWHGTERAFGDEYQWCKGYNEAVKTAQSVVRQVMSGAGFPCPFPGSVVTSGDEWAK